MKDILSSLRSLSLTAVASTCGRLWTRSFRYVLLLCALVAVYIVGSVWYENIVLLHDLGEEKEQEINVRKDAVRFDEAAFTSVNALVDERRAAFGEGAKGVRDVFFPDVQSAQQAVVAAQEVVPLEQETVPVSDADIQESQGETSAQPDEPKPEESVTPDTTEDVVTP